MYAVYPKCTNLSYISWLLILILKKTLHFTNLTDLTNLTNVYIYFYSVFTITFLHTVFDKKMIVIHYFTNITTHDEVIFSSLSASFFCYYRDVAKLSCITQQSVLFV